MLKIVYVQNSSLLARAHNNASLTRSTSIDRSLYQFFRIYVNLYTHTYVLYICCRWAALLLTIRCKWCRYTISTSHWCVTMGCFDFNQRIIAKTLQLIGVLNDSIAHLLLEFVSVRLCEDRNKYRVSFGIFARPKYSQPHDNKRVYIIRIRERDEKFGKYSHNMIAECLPIRSNNSRLWSWFSLLNSNE